MQRVIRIIEDSGANFDMNFENFVAIEQGRVQGSDFRIPSGRANPLLRDQNTIKR